MAHTYDIKIRHGLGSLSIPDWTRLSIEEDEERGSARPDPVPIQASPGFRGALAWFFQALRNLLTFWRHSAPAPPTETTGVVKFLAIGEDESLKVPATFERSSAGVTIIRGHTTIRHGDLSESDSFGCEIVLGGVSGRLWMKPMIKKDFEDVEDTEAYIQQAGGGG